MKGKQRKGSKLVDDGPAPAEPRWRQRKPPARRQKVRKHQTVAPKVEAAIRGGTSTKGARPGGDGDRGGAGKPGLRLPALSLTLRLPRPAWHQLALPPLLALLVFGIWQLSYDNRFFVFEAEIQGNDRVPSEAIYAASGIDSMSIFWVRADEVRAQVKTVEGIADASVHVRLPNKVVIDVRERAPLVIWRVGGQDLWISEDGEVIPSAGPAPALALNDPTAAAASRGERPAGSAAAPKTSAGAQVTGTLRLSPVVLANLKALHAGRPDLKDIYYGRQEGLYFVAPEGWAVYLGDEGDVARKLATLQAVRQQAASEKVPPKVVDLRLEGQAFYR